MNSNFAETHQFQCQPTPSKVYFTTNPNNQHANPASCCKYQNYSKYECTTQPWNANRYWVIGQRHPECKPWQRSYGSYFSKCNTGPDDMRPSFIGYKRNARYVGKI